jgi:hypothetical protein
MGFRLLFIACTLSFLGTSLLPVFAEGPFPNTDMPGNDYKNFEMREGASACEQACMKESKCEAWTWVKQGVQGSTAS